MIVESGDEARMRKDFKALTRREFDKYINEVGLPRHKPWIKLFEEASIKKILWDWYFFFAFTVYEFIEQKIGLDDERSKPTFRACLENIIFPLRLFADDTIYDELRKQLLIYQGRKLSATKKALYEKIDEALKNNKREENPRSDAEVVANLCWHDPAFTEYKTGREYMKLYKAYKQKRRRENLPHYASRKRLHYGM
jgi:hypothetical protein